MIEDKDLFNFRKECIFQALQRNLEWAKRTNEIALQSKKWCIAYWLIYVGFFVKETNPSITWLQVSIGVLGIFFFLAWEMITHYYSELITEQRFKLTQSLVMLPKMTKEELLEFEPLPTSAKYTLTRKMRILVILSMLGHETLLYFYFGLTFFMLIVFIVIRYQR